jgi:cytochrome P450
VPTSDASPSTPGISSLEFWSRPAAERAAVFTELRRTSPVSFQEPSDVGRRQSGRGFWAVTTHADVEYVSRHADLFCSGKGVGLGEVPLDLLDLNASFLVMDNPRHMALRRIVVGAFTPKRIAMLQDGIDTEAGRIVDEFVDRGGGDVVQDLARKLPLWTISEMMGIPESLRGELTSAAEAQIQSQDPEIGGTGNSGATVAVAAARTMHAIAADVLEARRADPGDDILSALVQAELDGEPLTDQVLGGIFVLFSTAGNDTTRNTTSHAIKLFADNPAQWASLAEDQARLPAAVEEMVRYASPVIHFRRTATADTTLGGTSIASGDAVVMFYESANRDEAVFSEPTRFDISRNPNPHLGFGGGGPHFCLGANLARAQLRALFSRLSERVAGIEVGQPDYLASNFVNGVKRMPVTVEPR